MVIKSELWLRFEDCERSLCDSSQAVKHISYLAGSMNYCRHDAFNTERLLDMTKWEDEEHLTIIAYGDSIDERIFLEFIYHADDKVSALFHVIRNCPIGFGMSYAKFATFMSSRLQAQNWILTYIEPGQKRFVHERGDGNASTNSEKE